MTTLCLKIDEGYALARITYILLRFRVINEKIYYKNIDDLTVAVINYKELCTKS